MLTSSGRDLYVRIYILGILLSLTFALSQAQTATYRRHQENSSAANVKNVGNTGNGVTFTINTTGSITGTITRASDSAPINGAFVEAMQSDSVSGFTASASNGSYTISSLNAGTYDVRVSAIGYQTGVQTGVVVTSSNSTTIDKNLVDVATSGLTYIYNELGRLLAVVTPSEVATYSYDDVGNLTGITRGNASLVSIIEFTPNSGVVGTPVTIYGTGFSATPGNNTVKFNGVTAVVTSSTPTEIVTSVPAGATTGPISITAPAGTASSSTSFVIGDPESPTITSFSPTIGIVGTAVTITGTNFEPSFQNNKTKFNLTNGPNTAATNTTLAATVPSGAGSGRITVSTPVGSATSSGDFFIPPSPYTVADVAVTGRMAVGENKIVTLNTANKIGIVVFNGSAGDRVSLGMTAVTIGLSAGGTNVSIRDPFGSILMAPFNVGTDGGGTDTITLPVDGTYSIVVDPIDAYTGSLTLVLSAEVALPISIDCASLSLSLPRTGQNARLTFSGTAGQQVNIGVSSSTIGFSTWGTYISARNPDNSTLLAAVDTGPDGYGTNTLSLPATGTYTIFVDPRLAFTGNITITLSSELNSPITIDGSAVSLSLSRPGQNARLTFSGITGQRVSFGMGPSTIGFSFFGTYISAKNPDGSNLVSQVDTGTDGYSSNTLTLPSTGTYSIIVDPRNSYTGNVTATLSTELTNSISIDGSAAALTLRTGQNAKLTFTGNASQQAKVRLTNVTIGFSMWGSYLNVKNPDGSTLQSQIEFGPNGTETSYLTMPATGTYTILIDPRLAYSGNVTVRVVSPPPAPEVVTSPNSNDLVWSDDSVPAGAWTGGSSETWTWVTSNPTAISGTSAHQSSIVSGTHQHYFDGATTTMSINTGDKLIVYAYLDPNNMPSELMVQWNDGDWEHRAYWGANNIAWGTNNTNSRRYMGPLPAGGQWLRFVVPASEVGLEGRTIQGMAFTLHGGRATWDRAGKAPQ